MDWNDTLIRLGLALVLASPIGWEREAGHKPAGLRTHLLVSLGCCLFVLVGLSLKGGDATPVDPGRIAAQVVTGVGFLGGGAILRAGGAVRGLTTAASIWVVAAIGMACGVGYYMGAALCSIAGFGVLAGLDRWERRLISGRDRTTLRIHLTAEQAAQRAQETLAGLGFRPDVLRIERNDKGIFLVLVGFFSRQAISVAFQHLSEDPGFLGIERNPK